MLLVAHSLLRPEARGRHNSHVRAAVDFFARKNIFTHFSLCVLTVAIPTLSIPEIISCGKDLIFLIPIIFLVTVAIFCQHFCILGEDQIICSKFLFSLQFL